MKVDCPRCGRQLGVEELNVATDVATCRVCGEVFRLSRVLDGPVAEVLHDPPRGAWYDETYDGFELGASSRSWAALFLVPFTVVWSGGSMGMLYVSQLVAGEFDLFKTLFGLPFFIGSLFLVAATLMSLFGRIVVTVGRHESRVFSGLGPIGWVRRFEWDDVTDVVEVELRSNNNNNNRRAICLEGARRIRFGSMLNSARFDFMLNGLREAMLNRDTRR